MKKMAMLLLVLSAFSVLTGCAEFLHGDHGGSYDQSGSSRRSYSGGHSH